MSVINKTEELHRLDLLCRGCDVNMAEIFITIGSGGGASGYSYCKKCALDLALSILRDYGEINDRKAV